MDRVPSLPPPLPPPARAALLGFVTGLRSQVPVALLAVEAERGRFDPGVGRLAYDAIQKTDLPTVQGTVLMGAFFIIFLNLIVDIVYAFLDPRVRY